MSYSVQLEVFEGPFDLLLQLISQRQLEVTEVDLADITADFLAHLEGLEELDLDTATRFLVVAATLIELKAMRLLPREQQEDLEDVLGETRDLLYARLLEYRAFRDVAAELRARLAANRGHVGRAAPLEPRFRDLVPSTELTIDAPRLARLAAVALAPRPEPRIDVAHVQRAYLSVRHAAELVFTYLPEAGSVATFRRLAAGRDRGDRVALFLALLELYKLGQVDLAQSDPTAELSVQRHLARGEHALDDAVLDLVGEPDAPEPDEPEPDAAEDVAPAPHGSTEAT